VKPWSPKLDINTDAIATLPFWIQFPGLDIKYWGTQCLSKFGGMLGTPLKMDKCIKEKTVLKYARMLVKMHIDGPFLEYIEFANEKDIML